MPTVIDFYCIGFVIAFMWSMYRLQEDNRVEWLDIVFSIFIGAFSWIGVLALYIGGRLKQLNENK